MTPFLEEEMDEALQARDCSLTALPALLSTLPQLRSLSKSEGNEHTQRVRFSRSYISVRRTITRSEYTKEERQKCWYEGEEYAKMNLAALERMAAGKPPNKDDTYRGLEKKTELWKLMSQDKYLAIEVVIHGQNMAKLQDKNFDSEAIANLYQEYSEQARLLAINLAHGDEREAMKILDDGSFYCNYTRSLKSNDVKRKSGTKSFSKTAKNTKNRGKSRKTSSSEV